MGSCCRNGCRIFAASVSPVLAAISYIFYLHKENGIVGQSRWTVLLVIIPPGLLIIAMLHAGSTRDMLQDKAAGRRTRALKMGLEGSQIAYQTLLLVAYLLIAIMVMIQMLDSWVFLVLLSFPLAIKNLKLMKKATMDDLEIIRSLDIRTARLVLIFSLLMMAGNIIASL